MRKVIIGFCARNISYIMQSNLNLPCGAIHCALQIQLDRRRAQSIAPYGLLVQVVGLIN